MELAVRAFRQALRSHLYPILAEDGFARVRSQFRRVTGRYIHCLSVQERSNRAAVCGNLGVHLDLMPIGGRTGLPDAREVCLIDCDIQTRLAPGLVGDFWVPYDGGVKSVLELVHLYEVEGREFFNRYVDFPGDLAGFRVEDIEQGTAQALLVGMTRVRCALLLALVNVDLGDLEKASRLAKHGLDVAGRATAIKPHFRRILAQCNGA